jgi:SAM-dependent methyltransferase
VFFVSEDSWPMPWCYPLTMRPSISCVVSSAQCSFPTARLPTEAKRVLKPGGHFLFNVWDRIEENDFADDLTNALARIFPDDPPRFTARTPPGYRDTALIRRELEGAGFSPVAIQTISAGSRASSPRIPAVAYCQGTVLRSEIEARDAGKTASCN